MKNTFMKIVALFAIVLAANAVKVYIGEHRDTAGQEAFYAYIHTLKRQNDFAAFDYWLGLAILNTGKTAQQLNLELKQHANDYSRKMSKRPSLGRKVGYYVALKNDVEKLYRAFRTEGFSYTSISYTSGRTNNLDQMLAVF